MAEYVHQDYPKMIYQSGKPGEGPYKIVQDKKEEEKVKSEWRKDSLKEPKTKENPKYKTKSKKK